MKKEKQIKSYQRKTKSGKTVTVKSHTAKYDATEKAREAAKKKGAGEELLKKKKTTSKKPLEEQVEEKMELLKEKMDSKKVKAGKETTMKSSSKTSKTPTKGKSMETPKASSVSVTSAEFKAWYHDPKTKTGKAIAKKLKEQLGAEKYKELNKKADAGYSPRGHISMYKSLGASSSTGNGKKTTTTSKETKNVKKPVPSVTADEFNKWITDPSSAKGKQTAKKLKAEIGEDKLKVLYKKSNGKAPNGNVGMFKYSLFLKYKEMLGDSHSVSKATSKTKEAKEKTPSKKVTTVKESAPKTKATKDTTNKTSISPGGKPVPAREEEILTRAAKLPKGVSLKGGWHRVDASGTKGVGYSSWSSKADVYEAVLSNGKKAILKRTYGPAGEDKTTFE